MDAKDFQRIVLSPDGVEENSHMGALDFWVGGRIFATLAREARLREFDADAGATGGIRERIADVFVPVHGGWGKNGATYIVLEMAIRRCAGRGPADSVDVTMEKYAKSRRKSMCRQRECVYQTAHRKK